MGRTAYTPLGEQAGIEPAGIRQYCPMRCQLRGCSVLPVFPGCQQKNKEDFYE